MTKSMSCGKNSYFKNGIDPNYENSFGYNEHKMEFSLSEVQAHQKEFEKLQTEKHVVFRDESMKLAPVNNIFFKDQLES